MAGYQNAWAMLGIARTSDARAVKRAYAAKLKAIDVETDRDGFMALRAAFEQAQREAEWAAQDEAAKANAGDADSDAYQDEDWEDWGESRADYPAGDATAQAAALPRPSSPDLLNGIEVRLTAPSPFPFGLLIESGTVGDVMVRLGERADEGPVPIITPPELGVADGSEMRGQSLELPDRALHDVFPPELPFLRDLIGFDPEMVAAPSSAREMQASASVGTGVAGNRLSVWDDSDMQEGAPAAPAPIEPQTRQIFTYRRDDWGNADRARLVELLSGASFGPAETDVVLEIGNRLLASQHIEEIDYRDWFEEWLAALIAEHMPRTDGLLRLAAQKFRCGTETGLLHQTHAMDAAIGRYRDLLTIDKLENPQEAWHSLYKMLQEPAPLKFKPTRHWEQVRDFIDNVRVERPTVEWNLDRQHVALWDDFINRKMNRGAANYTTPTLRWYHYLFFAFMVLQLIGRCATYDPTAPSNYEEVQRTSDTSNGLIDYKDAARVVNNRAELAERERLGPLFNERLQGGFPLLTPGPDFSSYFTLHDIRRFLTDCNNACLVEIAATVEKIRSTSVSIGTPPPLPPPAMPKSATPKPATPPVPAATPIELRYSISFDPNDASVRPKVIRNAQMKKLGFTEADIKGMEQLMVNRILPDGKVKWECAKACGDHVDKLLARSR